MLGGMVTTTRGRASIKHRPGGTLAMRLAVAIVCAAGLIIALSGCGAGDRDPRLAVLDRAAAADAPFGVRYRFSTRYTDDEGAHRLRGYGQAEAEGRRSRVVVVRRDTRGETIIDGHDEYSGGDFALAGLIYSPPNVRWTKFDRAKFRDAGYIDEVCGAELPAKIAAVLAGSDPKLERLGATRIGGVRMRRYRVTTTYGRVLDALAGKDDASHCDKHDRAAKLVADLWIDRRDLVWRVRLRYDLADGRTVETRDVTRYDRGVHVRVPAGRTVGDVTDAVLRLTDAVCETADDC